ncbi:lectin-like protein [Archangium sp.]|jgi:hypothetical protein|uniref:lectin-like protein n=1 Tax=Archangium sp. TaxID=1872627 RepID=UPI002ED85759
MDSTEFKNDPALHEETLGEIHQRVMYNGHDYIFASTPKTWPEAYQSCADIGYGLATINNSAEDAWLNGNLSSSNSWWIGYNDRDVEGTWRWSNGASAYVNWSPGEPNDWGSDEDCGVKYSGGAWNDDNCFKKFQYICESVDVSVTINYFEYSASNTSSASQNTTNVAVTLQAGQTLTVGTCGISGTFASGDTYLRLYGPNGFEVAYNDDSCGGLSSNFSYAAPAGGTYVIRAGCYGSGACSGRVGYTF